jgi:hypothetical protein
MAFGVKIVEMDMVKAMSYIQEDASRTKSEYNSAIRRGDTVRAKEILKEVGLPQ